MPECVKCGYENRLPHLSCADCGWPFVLDAWAGSKHRIRRISIDTGRINAKRQNPSLNTLDRWAVDGKILIERSAALLGELRGASRIAKAMGVDPHPEPWQVGVSLIGIDTFVAGPDLSEPIADTLFPTTSNLSGNQEADVEHLRSHVQTGSDVFVTRNPRDFIRWGKQSQLRQLGIGVFEPAELVDLLRRLYGWA